MSLKGAPDWSRPLKVGGGDLYFGYEAPTRLFAPPVELVVASEGPAAPAFALEVFRVEGAERGPEVFGLVTIRFTGAYALAERQLAVFARHPEARVEPLAPRSGFLRFEAASALGLPASLTEPRPLVWAGAGALTFAARLDGPTTALLRDALLGGLALAAAVVEVEAAGVAARADARVRFDPAALAAAIWSAVGAETCSPTALAALLAAPDGTAPVAYEGLAGEPDRPSAAEAFADRLLARFARPAPSPDPSAGPAYRFDFDAMASGAMTWDLAEPVLVGRVFVVRSDPLATARRALAAGAPLLRSAPTVPFATGLHLLTVDPNLPARRAGVLAIGVEVRVPPCPPDRPQTVTASARLRAGERLASIPIRLAPQEPVAFEYQAVAVVAENAGAARLAGPWRRHEGLHLTVPPDAVPLRFVRVAATPALLRAARLAIRCRGVRRGAAWSAEAALEEASPTIAIAVPLDLEGGEMLVTARALGDGGEIALGPLPLDDLWLDLASFPTAGPRRLEVRCRFDDAAEVVAIECAPEDRIDDADASALVRLTPALSQREWRWLATDPFRSGYRCRWFQPPGEPPTPWSEPRDPAAPLTFTSSSRTRAAVPGGQEVVR